MNRYTMQICHMTMNTMNQYPEVWLTHRPIDAQDIKNMYKSHLISLLVDLDFSTFHMWHKYSDKNKRVHLPYTQYNKHFHLTCYIIVSKNMIHWKITVTKFNILKYGIVLSILLLNNFIKFFHHQQVHV